MRKEVRLSPVRSIGPGNFFIGATDLLFNRKARLIFSQVLLFMLAVAFAFVQQARGQVVIGGWNTSALPGGTNDFGPSPFSATTTAANVTVGGLTRGSGVGTTGTGAARAWGGNNWNSTEAGGISGNQFVTFTVKANAGYKMSLSSINPFDYRRSSAGAGSGALQYKINAGSYVPIATLTFSNTSSSGGSVGSTDLSGIAALQNLPSSSTVTFRIVPYGASAAGGTFYIFDTGNSTATDFAVNGTVCPVITFTATPTNTCPGGSNGQIAVSGVSGGTAPYMYSKNNGANYQTGSTFSGLAANTYQVLVKDANGCTSDAAAVVVGTNTPPACSIAGDDYVCNNSTGNMYDGPAGMSAYNWGISGDGSIPGSTTGSSVSVTAGNFINSYTVYLTVTDGNGCASSCSKESFIYWFNPPVNITVNPNPGCFGATLDLSVNAASSSTVSWSGEGIVNASGNPATTAITTTTGPHTYTATVTTDYGCSNTGMANITINPLPPAPSCPGNSSVCLTAPAFALSGGSPGGGAYSGPGVSAGNFNPSAAGTGMHAIVYSVTDGNGCSNSCSFSITVDNCPADLSLIKSATPTAIDSNGVVQFSLVVSNAGTYTATNATVTDVVPVGLSYIGGSQTGPGTLSASGSPTTLKWQNLTIPSGGSVTLGFSARDLAGYNPPYNVITNFAEVTSSGESDPDSSPNNGDVGEDDGDTARIYMCPVTLLQALPAPANVSITNSICGAGCNTSGGTIAAPAPPPLGLICPYGSALQYQVNGGAWSNTLPIYAQTGPPQTIKTRCSCKADDSVFGAESAPVTTAPGGCANPSPVITGPAAVCSGGNAMLDAGAGYAGYAWSGGGGSGQMATYNNITAPATYTVTVTDGNGCSGTDTHTVSIQPCEISFNGRIFFSNNNALGVKDAKVNLTGSTTGMATTDMNGDFSISTVLTTGSFTLKPTKTINKLNGITTGDATAIQQHVANITPITDLYKQVAADVNKSNSITALDASIVNQALLGNPAAFAQFSTSWRFVPTSHTMNNPPWGFPEQRNYVAISGVQNNQDFYGIKTGDVVTTYANPANFGAGAPLTLRVSDRVLQAGENLDAMFSAGQSDDVAAIQFALRFDPARLRFEAIEPLSGLPLSADHFGLYNIAEGEIRVVWSQAKGLGIAEAAPVFRLRFTALENGAKLSEMLQLDDDVLPARTYNSALAESPVRLSFSGSTATGDLPAAGGGVQLLQNRPNPFNGTTAIGFVLPEACEAHLRIFDVSGRMLTERKAQYPAGKHEETFDLQGASGMLYYVLTTPYGIATRKMAAGTSW